jgi:predicted DNA-binding protein with PD1-like motif
MDDGEDLVASLQKFVQEKKIDSCMVLFIGALRDGQAVTGPEMPVIPPVPHFEGFDNAWEVFGMGTIYPSAVGPKLHIHSAIGRGRQAIVGCIRESAKVYLVVEAILYEFFSLEAKRVWDESTELYLLSLENKL